MSLRNSRLTSPAGAPSPTAYVLSADTVGSGSANPETSDGVARPVLVLSGEVAIVKVSVFARVHEYTGGGAPTVGDLLYYDQVHYFYNTGSGATQVGGIAYPGNSGDFGGSWSFDLSGDRLGFEVTGSADENANWVIRVGIGVG